tara:strand:+ start:2448 stop:3953 length:1506 start_codon:yes stop_codon:yes gene_type:complete
MANYTITNFLTTETKNDSIFFNNMATSGSITIKPNSGYVVSASDFSVINLPSSIESVVFTNSSTAGAVGNNVVGTATFSSDFTASSNLNIFLNIVGDAKLFDENDVSFSFKSNIIDNSGNNLFATSTFTDSTSSLTESTTDGIKTVAISSTLKKDVKTTIGILKVTATSGYYFKNKPILFYKNSDADFIVIETTSVVKSSGNVFIRGRKSLITEYSFDIIATVNRNITTSDINLIYTAHKIHEEVKQITSFNFSRERFISALGETKNIKIKGTRGAEFSLITHKSDGTSILRATNDTVISSTFGSIPCITTSIPGSSISKPEINYIQRFPASSSETYTLSIIPKNGTTLGSSVKSKYLIKQVSNPVITFQAIESQANVRLDSSASIQFTGRPGKFMRDLEHISGLRSSTKIIVIATAINSTAFNSPPTVPTWSSSDQSSSSWTNSVPSSSQGNNQIEIVNISAVRSNTNTTLTVEYDVLIKRFGDGNTTFTLNIDNIATSS